MCKLREHPNGLSMKMARSGRTTHWRALNKHKLPLRFLLASRPEPHIRNAFDNLAPHQNASR